jgi:tRNA (guanosine-2'-O-)-methyltransferase
VKQYDSTALKRLHREWRHRTTARLALVLDSVQTPVNVGSIARLAAAYRVEHLWLAGATVAPTHPGARKTALGSDRYLEWTVTATALEAVDAARAGGFACVALELAAGATPIYDADLDGAVCLVIGHEDRGVSPAALAACDRAVFIPQVGRIGSLNVATATAIALYETRRREWTRT